MPKIAVIVPVYNVEKYIVECVNSILRQTLKDFLLVLVDDGSPDNCGEICDEYAKKDKRIFVIHKNNGGLSSARNAGLDYIMENKDIEYISFVDSDDYVLPTFLERLFCSIESNKSDMSLCNFYRVKENGVDSKSSIDRRFNPRECVFNKTSSVVAWNKLYKKELFKNIRYPVGKIHEDEHVIHRLVALCEKISYVDDALYCYRQNKNSIINTETEKQRMLCSIDYLSDRLYFYYYENKNSEMADKCYHILFKKMVENYRVLGKTIEYKKTFLVMKKIYKNRKKTKYESVFFCSPLVHKILIKLKLLK